jgi:GNAT superfamily N-acetyltransferase
VKEKLQIRLWQEDDSVSELTELLHRAYKQLADMGLRFLATHQDDSITLDRITHGKCYLGLIDDAIISTVTLYPTNETHGTPWYDKEYVAHFGQFGVEPHLQRNGIGDMMMDHVESIAKEDGVNELALDTSEKAGHLIRYYTRRGYRFVEYTQWPEVNYRSVIMTKTLS